MLELHFRKVLCCFFHQLTEETNSIEENRHNDDYAEFLSSLTLMKVDIFVFTIELVSHQDFQALDACLHSSCKHEYVSSIEIL